MKGKRQTLFLIVTCALLLPILIGFALSVGAVSVSPSVWLKMLFAGGADLSGIDENTTLLLLQLRLPRILMAVLVGGMLAVCGSVYQSVFRNPICDPYILGVSSGASLGAAVAFVWGVDTFLFGVSLPALVTALLTLSLVFLLSSSGRGHSPHTMLLVGVALNFLFSAVITLLMVLHQESMNKILFWTMGSLSGTTWLNVALVFFVSVFVGVGLLFFSKDLNVLQLGDDAASTLGVDVRRVRLVVLTLSSVAIAVMVSFCGVIGFIGLVVPHIVRMSVGASNDKMMVCSFFVGAIALLLADTVARTIALPSELPVGTITALVGAPYFIFLLFKKG